MLRGEEFAALMAPLGPFPPDRRVAVAVSGGADSLALALLAKGWGQPLALVADHGLRSASAAEARLTIDRLTALGIPSRLLPLTIRPGPALAERARAARYAALTAACEAAGLPHLLLGHHAGDQAETVLLRAFHGSGPDGRAGMAPLQPAGGLCLLRPLLTTPPVRLRETLRAAGLDWIEDPSNHDLKAERARLRALIAEPDGQGPRTAGLLDASCHWAAGRAARAAATAEWLAANAILHPGLHAEIADPAMPHAEMPHANMPHANMSGAALAALIQTVTGAAYPPPTEPVRQLAERPRPATIAGARLLRGRGCWHIARELSAAAPPIPAIAGAIWDGRFRLDGSPGSPLAVSLGALGADAAAWRRAADSPAAVLASLPCLRRDGAVIAIPHLGIGDPNWRLLPLVNRPATATVVISASPM